jgi:phosphoribosyl-ATP pyrophosphohydrolase/phosphoribosyl-AMP cyclohydrolase
MKNITFDEKGLIPAIIQDANTGEVLMLGYMNEESLRRTMETKEVWFYSRSRQELWHKGETSGNIIKLKNIKYNCENNSLLVSGYPSGPVCHTGNKTCFYREFTEDYIKEG